MKRKLLLTLLTLVPILASASDAEIDGIYYNFSGEKATVTYRDYGFSSYSGVVVIPESVTYNSKTYSVTSIGSWAFFWCSGLTSVNIPNSVTSIGEGAFAGCSGLTSVNIPNSVTSIGYMAFSDCSGLTSIKVETGNTKYDSRNNCNAIIETATKTLIAGCQNTIIPNSVTSIGCDAFEGCSGLTSVTIPGSVTSIGYWAFAYCSGLTDVYCYAENVPSTESDAFEESPIASATLHVPASALDAYKTTEPWSGFGNIVPLDGNPGEHEYVDLGLPSGTLWATCNVGASKPEEYGDYFAWGETKPKDNYTEDTYTYQLPSNATELEPSADAATVNWGSEWQMPSTVQMDELINEQYTTVECRYDDNNNIIGYQITSKSNGESILLPYAGLKYGTTRYDNSGCFYWSRSVGSSDEYGCCLCGFSTGLYNKSNFMIRSYGATVRPVRIPKLVSSIELTETSLTLYPGESKNLNAKILPEDADNKAVTWSSSNTGVATVDLTGKVTAIASGTCTITCAATDGSGVKATCAVTVVQPVTGITLSQTSLSLSPGNSQTLTATIQPTNATNKSVKWSSSKSSVATVDQNGKVTAEASGSCTITCTAQDGSGVKAECQVEVIEEGTDTWYLVARDSLGTETEYPMAIVGSLVAVDDASDFCVLDTFGNVLVEGVIKVTFRPDEEPLAVKSITQAENIISRGVTDQLTLIGVSGDVNIFDINGKRQVHVTANGGETVISIAHLPAGVYIVKAGKQTFKFIKK